MTKPIHHQLLNESPEAKAEHERMRPRYEFVNVSLGFHYNPPGLGKGVKELSVQLARVDNRLVVQEAQIVRGIPSDVFGASPRRPHVDTGIGWANKTYNLGISADSSGEVNVWGNYGKPASPAIEQAALALTKFGQTLWREGFR